MNFEELLEHERTQLNELSKWGGFGIGTAVGTAVGITAMAPIMAAVGGLAVPALVASALLNGVGFGAYVSMFSSGSLKTISKNIENDLKAREKVYLKLYDSVEMIGDKKMIDLGLSRKFNALTEKIHKSAEKFIKLAEQGKGGAGHLRMNIGASELETLVTFYKLILSEVELNKVITINDVSRFITTRTTSIDMKDIHDAIK